MNSKSITNLATPVNLTDATNKNYVDEKVWDGSDITTGTISKDRLPSILNTFSMGDTLITNLATPINLTDAVNKNYVDTLIASSALSSDYIRYMDYSVILNNFRPKFWISAFYSNGLKIRTNQTVYYVNPTPVAMRYISADVATVGYSSNQTTIEIGIEGSNNYFNLNASTTGQYISSLHSFAATYTFIGIAKRINPSATNGRVFTSNTGNKLFGWHGTHMRCAWHDEEVYGMSSNITNADSNIHMFTYRVDSDYRQFYDGEYEICHTSNGANSDWGQLLVGSTLTYSVESANAYTYEILGFDTRLSMESLGIIWTIFKKYFNIYNLP
jgi:hypothetical protein